MHLGRGRIGAAIADIVKGRAVEHRGVLRDHRDLAAQAVLLDAAHIDPVDQHLARLCLVEPQQKGDQRRFPRTRGTDDPQFLARRDGQVDPIDTAILPPIGKACAHEIDAPRGLGQFQRIGGIDQRMGRGQRAHPILDLAQIGVDRHQGETHPARHLRDPHGDRADGRDLARADAIILPQHDTGQHQGHRQDPRRRHQDKAEHGRKHPELQRGAAIALHRGDGGLILVVDMTKQLDRLDIGDGVDDLACHIGPRGGPRLGQRPHARQIPADHRRIGQRPDRQDQADPPIDGGQHQHGPRQRCNRESTGIDRLGHDVHEGGGRLHLLLRDATGEIIVEKADGMAQRPAMQPALDQGRDIGRDDDPVEGRRRPEQERPDQQEERDIARDQQRVVGKVIDRPMRQRAVDDHAQQPGRDDLHRAGQGREQRGKPDHRPCA